MDNLVPMDVAAEHYAAAMIRGENAGTAKEYERVMEILKKHGHYDSVLLLKKHERKSQKKWTSQRVF